MQNPFVHPLIRDWFVDKSELFIKETKVITTGSGPFLGIDFDVFLFDIGIDIYDLESDLSILVIGRTKWDEKELDNLIEIRKGKTLKVYSQEMFLSYLITGKDPYKDKKILKVFGENHPALEYLEENGFKWPETTIVPHNLGEFTPESQWPNIGLLKKLGYQVGANGKSKAIRREILKDVFESEFLYNVKNKEYMEQWGEAETKKRLLKMANTLASFARNAKRKENPLYAAIEDWEEDLQWIKEKFYKGKFRFNWPDTEVY